jgi:pSer/pThr/pTyr-binding forkhead associated (FHA) protein
LANARDIPEIIILRDGVEIARQRLDRSPVRLGRDPDNELVLDDAALSGRHVEIVDVSGQWWVRCLDNTQRLRVGDQTCHAHALRDGDRIGVGPFDLLFVAPPVGEPDGPAPRRPDEDVVLDQTRIISPGDTLDIQHDPSAAPTIEIPGYQIGREIGRGGMGIVYETVQVSTQRTVALKIMLEGPYTSEKTKRRFEREVHIVASLRHPNIAQIYESGLHQGRYWFAMEYVDGQPLDAPELRSSLSMPDRLTLMATVCEAVGHAHERMIVHRDLKPSNIMISADGQPHVLDFGLAKVEDPRTDPAQMLSLAGELMGTPAYMSPEQTEADPSKVDAHADVYALGVIFYQFLTGQFPYNV